LALLMEPTDINLTIGSNDHEGDPGWTHPSLRARRPPDVTCDDQAMGRGPRTAVPAALAAAAIALAGCSSTQLLNAGRSATSSASAAAARSGPAAPADAVAVIKGWADALRRGDVTAAAGYFKIPSVLVDGAGPAITIRSLRQAEAANAALPCGATLISTSRRGPYVNALFRLSGRPGPGGSSCTPGAGTTARTDFLIENGRIHVWLRAPDQPGDNGSPPSGRPPGTSTAPPGPTV
jgi:hypothetical protein